MYLSRGFTEYDFILINSINVTTEGSVVFEIPWKTVCFGEYTNSVSPISMEKNHESVTGHI